MPVREGGRYVADDKGEHTLDAKDKPTATPDIGALDPKAERVGAEKPAGKASPAPEEPAAPPVEPAAIGGSKTRGN